MKFDRLHNLMQQAAAAGVFPGGVLLVSRQGVIVDLFACGVGNRITQRPVTAETVFDLASLTKPLATTLAVMLLVADGRLSLGQPLASLLGVFKGTDKAAITVRQLLNHTSGLPDYRPYYTELVRVPHELRRQALLRAIARTPLAHGIGQAELYSDLGFMVLGEAVETISGKRLDRLVGEAVYAPLGLNDGGPPLCFIDHAAPTMLSDVAATEFCSWRQCLLEGVVHDENAFALGGIAGHAGLFGSARAVHTLIAALWKAFRGDSPEGILPVEVVQNFLRRGEKGERPLGFDTPSKTGSSSGRYFTSTTVGHLGFTGTSFWLDLQQAIGVILLTNRVHPHRTNERIKTFRPKLHDAVMNVLRTHTEAG
ncbi:MAG: serine hydrolase domain-containing protein [Desulfobacterales bacterium]|jgi:CubicO group peptidase (beta-lactamase class C family)